VFRIAAKVAMLDAGRIVFTVTPEQTLGSDMPVVARFLAGQEDPRAGTEDDA
jgi:ABC-type transporter Mla maintaining outer membrane lipid asymmetry ATPase subunit MlaF